MASFWHLRKVMFTDRAARRERVFTGLPRLATSVTGFIILLLSSFHASPSGIYTGSSYASRHTLSIPKNRSVASMS
jgi:hypothetical protein